MSTENTQSQTGKDVLKKFEDLVLKTSALIIHEDGVDFRDLFPIFANLIATTAIIGALKEGKMQQVEPFTEGGPKYGDWK